MTSREEWQRIEAILDELLELAPEKRDDRLAELTEGDEELRRQVRTYLSQDGEPGFLDESIGGLAASVLEEGRSSPASEPERIGPYRVLGELGRGGMGRVLLAERADGDFEQRIALKIILEGTDRAEIVARFRRERRILARLRHPNIAALYDGGAMDDGAPYFAMEYVEGERITDWCDANELGIDERIELFESVCVAVQYAHRNLVVHRDIKPGNVLVTPDGTVKLLDFGIGKVLDPEDPERTQHTRGLLTPSFAAPEQIRGEATSTSADVFSLGMLLYVLLTGHHPHGELSRSVDVVRAIVEEEPPIPSARAGQDTEESSGEDLAKRRGAAPHELRRRLRGDLDNILRKALQKNPDDRYASAEELRADLERHRKSLPVHAHAPTPGYRLRKFIRRNRLAATAIAAVVVAVLVGVSGVAWQAGVAARERDRVRVEAERARAVKDYLIEVFSSADPSYEDGASLSARELVERGALAVGERFADDPGTGAEITRVLGTVLTSLAQYDRAETILRSTLEEQRALDDPDGLQETLLALGQCLLDQGNHEEAHELYVEAEELCTREFGADDPRTISAASSRAAGLSAQGRYEEAESLYREIIDRAERVFGAQDARSAPHHSGLATVLSTRGDLDGAEVEYRAAISTYRQAGVGGVRLSTALTNLGTVVDGLDRKEEAEDLLREAVAVLREEYGEEGHPDLAVALSPTSPDP